MKLILCLCALSTSALAASCEERFSKSGNPLTGTKYQSTVMVPQLSVADAIAQLHGIAVGKKLDILTEDAANGSMLLEDRESMRHKPIPYVVSVASEGDGATIQLLVKLNAGAIAKAEDAKKEICSILSLVKGGDEGTAAAALGANAAGSNEPRKVDALMLSLELARQTRDSAESVPLRYKDRAFTVSGRVKYVMKDGNAYRVAFDIPEPREMLLKPGPMEPQFKIDISCVMAVSQSAWAIALREREKVKLTGTFLDFDQFKKVMWLGECKPDLR